jgi:hypothetical protein
MTPNGEALIVEVTAQCGSAPPTYVLMLFGNRYRYAQSELRPVTQGHHPMSSAPTLYAVGDRVMTPHGPGEIMQIDPPIELSGEELPALYIVRHDGKPDEDDWCYYWNRELQPIPKDTTP